VALLITYCSLSTNNPSYKNAGLSANERAKDLLSRMSIEEKIAQMVGHGEEVSLILMPIL